MHLRINRLLDMHQNNQHLKDFLAARNPRHQHSSSFESYLIKPVQRILKYPLLLQQLSLYSNTNGDHPQQVLVPTEIFKLKQAISMMNDIGEYMNGMQQLYEDFGQSFEQIIKSYSEERKKVCSTRSDDAIHVSPLDVAIESTWSLCLRRNRLAESSSISSGQTSSASEELLFRLSPRMSSTCPRTIEQEKTGRLLFTHAMHRRQFTVDLGSPVEPQRP